MCIYIFSNNPISNTRRVTGQPSGKTSYVVMGEGAGPKKLQVIAKLGIKTLTEDEFLNLISTRFFSYFEDNIAVLISMLTQSSILFLGKRENYQKWTSRKRKKKLRR